MLKKILTYYLLTHGAMLFAQSADDVSLSDGKRPFILNPRLDLSVGPVFGMHPNLRNIYPKGYYFIEGKASATVLNLPLNLTFRQSDEALRFGRASYFKLSLDTDAYRRQNISALSANLKAIDSEVGEKQKLLYELEAKLSYLYQKKLELQNAMEKGKPTTFSFDAPDLDLKPLPSNPLELKKPDSLSIGMPDLNFAIPTLDKVNLDSLNLKLDAMSKTLGDATAKLGELKKQQEDLKADYAMAMAKKPVDFMSGIKKMDFGLTTMGKSSMSRNAVPIQGAHVQYAGERYFTDVAAGFTLPSQLFSNQAFDQILYNSGNVFNMGDFFQVNNVRFVSSAKAGIGKENGNHLAIENYYSGKTLKKSTSGIDPVERGLTSNLTSRYSPVKWKNFSWTNTVGITWTTKTDTSSTAKTIKITDRIALFSAVSVAFPKLKSNLDASYRKIPSAYDGWIQGIYLNQTERIEMSYKQLLTRKVRTSLRFSRDFFFLQNALNSMRMINQAGIDVQVKISSHMVASGNYSLLQLKERAVLTPRSDLSHLARLGLSSTHSIAKNEFTTLHDVSYARINGFDSTQTLFQATAKYMYQLKHWQFGCQVMVSDFTGLTRLYGRNAIVQPEIGYKYKTTSFLISAQRLWSNQFGRDYGIQFRTHFAFSEDVDCDFMMQRFLPTEYALFIDPGLEYQKPFYLKFSLNIHIGNNSH